MLPVVCLVFGIRFLLADVFVLRRVVRHYVDAAAVPGIVDADICVAGVEFDVVAYTVSGLSGVYLWVCFPCRHCW